MYNPIFNYGLPDGAQFPAAQGSQSIFSYGLPHGVQFGVTQPASQIPSFVGTSTPTTQPMTRAQVDAWTQNELGKLAAQQAENDRMAAAYANAVARLPKPSPASQAATAGLTQAMIDALPDDLRGLSGSALLAQLRNPQIQDRIAGRTPAESWALRNAYIVRSDTQGERALDSILTALGQTPDTFMRQSYYIGGTSPSQAVQTFAGYQMAKNAAREREIQMDRISKQNSAARAAQQARPPTPVSQAPVTPRQSPITPTPAAATYAPAPVASMPTPQPTAQSNPAMSQALSSIGMSSPTAATASSPVPNVSPVLSQQQRTAGRPSPNSITRPQARNWNNPNPTQGSGTGGAVPYYQR